MDLKSLQAKVDDWINTFGVRYFDPMTNMAILTEEVGEVARLMSRIYGEQSFKEELSTEEQQARLADEIADVMWVLTCLANQCNVDLTLAVQQNLEKKTNRDKDRHRSNEKLEE